MNYRLIYMRIISNAKNEEALGLRKEGKLEKHHVLPKSLFPLWKNKKENIVKLTLKEHKFVHKLLYKIYPCYEMYLAMKLMETKNRSELVSISNKSPIRKFKRLLKTKTKDEAILYFNGEDLNTVLRFIKRENERIDNILHPKGNRGHTKGMKFPNASQKHKEWWANEDNKKRVSDKMKKWALENKDKLSHKGVNSKKIMCVETGEIFNSATEASKKYKGHITEAARGKRELAAGYHWKYI